MATVQTELKFNIRKRRYDGCKVNYGKENAVRTDTNINSEKLKKKSSESGTMKRSTLQLSDSEDELQDKNVDSSPTERGRTVEIMNDAASPQNITKCFSLTKYKQHSCASGSKYQLVRQALQSSDQTSMPGREAQLQQLHTFLEECLSAGRSDTLYISGPPGTGKTACLSKIMDVPKFKNGYKIISVNCTSMKSSGLIYKRIAQELVLKLNKQTEKECLSSIQRYLTSSHKMTLLVLDEIDQLDSRKQSVLYTIFEWPSNPNSRLVLIGIANALDLTDRILPRLQARLDLKPNLLHFPPYTKPQIVDILRERIKQSAMCDMFPQVTLELLAGKVASTSGDIRRALDIARRVVEIAESHKCDQLLPLQPTMDYGNRQSPRKTERATIPHRDGCVTIKDVMAVMNSVYGTSQTLVSDCDDSFPLQQKVVLATLLLIVKKGCFKDVTVGKFHEVYRRVCKKKNLLTVDQSEFLSLCKLVETRGILRVQERKDARLSKLSLQWDEEEVSSALKDKQLLSSILNDTSCLS